MPKLPALDDYDPEDDPGDPGDPAFPSHHSNWRTHRASDAVQELMRDYTRKGYTSRQAPLKTLINEQAEEIDTENLPSA